VMSRLEQGKQLLKEGDTLLKGGFFSSGKPEDAVRKYEEAMKKFRGIVPMSDEGLQFLLQACNKAGNLNSKLRYYTKASQAFEEGAKKLMKKETDPEQACQLYQKASENCRLATNFDKSGAFMLKAAEAAIGTETKIELAKQSCDIMIEEERMSTSRDHFQKAINLMMREGAITEALEVLLKQIEAINALSSSQSNATLFQSMLAVICIHLSQKSREQAYDAHSQFCNTSPFGASDQSTFARKLLKVFSDADMEALQSLRPDFGIYLVGEPARLFRKMNMQDLEPIDMTAAALDKLDLGEEKVDGKFDDEGEPDFT